MVGIERQSTGALVLMLVVMCSGAGGGANRHCAPTLSAERGMDSKNTQRMSSARELGYALVASARRHYYYDRHCRRQCENELWRVCCASAGHDDGGVASARRGGVVVDSDRTSASYNRRGFVREEVMVAWTRGGRR